MNLTGPSPVSVHFPRCQSPAARSSALLIILFFISILSIMLVAFLTSTRLEAFSARSHLNGIQASIYAQAGTDAALGKLYNAIGTTGNMWVSAPGQLYVSPTGTNAPVTTKVDLHSGAVGATSAATESADLNPTMLTNSAVKLLVSTNFPMRIKWIYQRKDGTLEKTYVPGPNVANPYIGRFAYWVDDETSKLNINTAWTHAADNTNSLAHPSRVDLRALYGWTDARAYTMKRYRETNHFFNSVDEMRGVADATISATVNTERMALTHYNHAPEVNMFGEQRILLTTQKSVANAMGSTNFIDILSTDNDDPGTYQKLNTTKINTVMNRILKQLSRKDWPFLSGMTGVTSQSFVEKYGVQSAVQFALNVIEYVRCAESQEILVDPIRGTATTVTPPVFSAGAMNATGNAFFGHTRHPLIVETGAYLPDAPSGGVYPATIRFRLFLPASYGATNVDLSTIGFAYSFSSIYLTKDNLASFVTDGTDTILKPGEYRTVSFPLDVPPSSGNRPTFVFISLLLYRNGSGSAGQPRMEHISFGRMPTNTVGTPITQMPSISAEDPRVNRYCPYNVTGSTHVPGSAYGDWNYNPIGLFNGQTTNAVYVLGNTPPTAYTPQLDTTSGGSVTDVGIRLPARKGVGPGMVQSVGELGYIHTGMNSLTVAAAGTPYRTLRLQPQKSGKKDIPDWAFLDLFAVPVPIAVTDSAVVLPKTTTLSGTGLNDVGGRVNVNAVLTPFVNASSVAMTRLPPLEAVLLNSKKEDIYTSSTTITTLAQADDIINAISQRTLSSAGGNAGQNFGNTSLYYHPGQLTEISGVSDRGEAGESLMREIVNLTTVRGGVFTIYAVGQSLKQDKNGNLQVSGERRTLTMVEREISAGKVYFKSVLLKDL